MLTKSVKRCILINVSKKIFSFFLQFIQKFLRLKIHSTQQDTDKKIAVQNLTQSLFIEILLKNILKKKILKYIIY